MRINLFFKIKVQFLIINLLKIIQIKEIEIDYIIFIIQIMFIYANLIFILFKIYFNFTKQNYIFFTLIIFFLLKIFKNRYK